jgi:hypothetical protein
VPTRAQSAARRGAARRGAARRGVRRYPARGARACPRRRRARSPPCCCLRVSCHRYYPDFYAPLVSDLTELSDLKLEFELGKPLDPLVQLLAVLPSESKQLLPQAYRDLMLVRAPRG